VSAGETPLRQFSAIASSGRPAARWHPIITVKAGLERKAGKVSASLPGAVSILKATGGQEGGRS
jgi:hypothetical protein